MSILSFMDKNEIRVYDKGKRYTHVSLSPPGKYLIENHHLEKFWNMYCDACHDTNLTICEKPDKYMPVLVDVDIKIEKDNDNDVENIYNDSHIMSLIQIYHDVLFEIVDNLKEEDFICCVLEKDPYFENKNNKIYKKNGFHLHFPKIFLLRHIQETELIPRIIQEIKKKIHLFPKNIHFDKCIDNNYCKGAPWLLYGSSKGPNLSYYEITYCVNNNMDKIHFRNALASTNIYDISGKKINFSFTDVDYYIPRILSISSSNRKEYMYDIKSNILSIKQTFHKMNQKDVHLIEDDQHYVEMIKRLLDILSIRRAEDQNEWMRVGWILYNILDHKNGYDLWIHFSKRCIEKYEENVCYYQWNRMQKRDLSIGSLKYMAKQDNFDEYNNIMYDFMQPYISKSIELKGSHNDLAKALFQKYESEFICSSIQHKTWYHFDDHIWKILEEGITLRQKISDEIVQLYFKTKEQCDKDYKFHMDEDNVEQARKIKKEIDVITRLISQLKSAPFKNNIMREAMEVFYNESFIKKLDSNPYLIAFQNGIYDLQLHEFREGQPSDYISLKLPINYKEFDMDDEYVRMVQDFFVKIFPDNTLREYFLNVSSEIFIGGNSSKIFQIWTGDGDNGKSITQNLFEKMLGPYSIKLPTSLITGKRTQSSCACPELVRAGNGVRLAMLQEPDQKDTINIGILKELSGNDTFFARALYKEGQEITPMFKLVLICNEPPKLPYNDKATWNRIRVIPFESTFTDEAPEAFEEQLLQKKFLKDKNFVDKIPKMIEPFAWLLLNRLRVKNKVIVEPDKVKSATSNYRKKNDIYKQFIDEFIIENAASSISLLELYSVFKDWYRDSMPNYSHNMPTKNELKEYFVKIWGFPIDNVIWKGFEIRNVYDMVSSSSSQSLNDMLPL